MSWRDFRPPLSIETLEETGSPTTVGGHLAEQISAEPEPSPNRSDRGPSSVPAPEPATELPPAEKRWADSPASQTPPRMPSGLLAPPPPPSVPKELPPALVREDEIELVFYAHEFGLRTFSEVTGEPLTTYSRSPAQRRQSIRDAIRNLGFSVVRQAARNLPLSPHHRGENEAGKKYLEVESAMRDPEYLAGLYGGPKKGLAKAIRESLKTSGSSASGKEDSTIPEGVPSDPEPQAPEKRETSPTPADIEAGKPTGAVSRPNPSFFKLQESVFDAHDLGLRTLAEVESRPFRPTDRKTAQNRRDVAAAICQAGVETARLAARNLVLSAYHRNDEARYINISQALGEAESIAALFQGPDEGLAEAIRESLRVSQPDAEEDPARGIEDGLQGVLTSAEEEALAEEIFG